MPCLIPTLPSSPGMHPRKIRQLPPFFSVHSVSSPAPAWSGWQIHSFHNDCGLFVIAKKVICLGIKNFRTLLPKCRGGVGIPNAFTGHPGWGGIPSRQNWFPAHVLHGVPNPRDVSVRRFSPSHQPSRPSGSRTTTYPRQPYASLWPARRSTCRASPSVAHVLSLSSPLRVLPLREAYVSKSFCG